MCEAKPSESWLPVLLTSRQSDHLRLTITLAVEWLGLAGGVPATCPHRAVPAYQDVAPASSKGCHVVVCVILKFSVCAAASGAAQYPVRIKLGCNNLPAGGDMLT